MANVIEAAETGYIALNDDSIQNLNRMLFVMIEEIRGMQLEKVASAATLATKD